MKSKTCSHCSTPKDTSKFYKNRTEPDGLQPWCKLCRGEADKKYYQENKDWIKEREWRSSLVRRYNITYIDYYNIAEKQKEVCAICEKPEPTRRQLCVDHDHTCCPGETSCGKCVRGLICSRCNRGIGLLSDSIKTLLSAIKYLRTGVKRCQNIIK